MPSAPVGSGPSTDAYEFYSALKRSLEFWPCKDAPNLLPFWWQLMDTCLGSIGLLKMLLLRLAAQQLHAPSEVVTPQMLAKAGKSEKALKKLREELESGQQDLKNGCYGESRLQREYGDLFQSLIPANVAHPRQPAGAAAHA